MRGLETIINALAIVASGVLDIWNDETNQRGLLHMR